MDPFEDEPYDDYESYALRQKLQPRGGQLMMTTQVTTKVPPGFGGKTSCFAFEDAIDDWCDIRSFLPELDLNAPAIHNEVNLRRQQHNAAQAALAAANDQHVIEPWTDEMEQVIYDEAIRLHKQAHRDLFPLSQNLIALISTAHLSQDQRQSLTSIMTHRNRTMDQYRVAELRDVFIELFCMVKTAVDNQ